MNKRKEFKIRFKDEPYDFTMILRTDEPEKEEDIIKEIKNHCRLYNASEEYFSPLDIMDDLCDEYGWEWEDYEYQEIEFSRKQWFGY